MKTLVSLLVSILFYHTQNYKQSVCQNIEWIQNFQIEPLTEVERIEQYINLKSNEIVEVEEYVSPQYIYEINDSEYDLLCRLVQSESGNEPLNGKIAVAQVVLYRAISQNITITEAIYAEGQFQVVWNGILDQVISTEETKFSVTEALKGNFSLEWGTEYFYAPRWTDSVNTSWFENSLIFTGQIENHRFFKK